MTTTTLRATYRKRGMGWEGVVKDASGKVVAECGHHHKNRDQSTGWSGKCARHCADALLHEIRSSDGGSSE